MSEVGSLYVTLRARTAQFNEAMARAGAEGEATGAKLRRGLQTTGLLVGASLIAGGVAAVKMAADFQASMTQINTLAMGGKGNINQLSNAVLGLAGQVGYSPNSLAQALYHIESNFYSVGLGGKQALEALKVAAEGAQIGGANLVDVTNALGAAVASGIPGVKNYQQAMQALLTTVGAGDMTMQNLADAFSNGILAIGKQYGLTLHDMGAALATLGDNNIRGAEAGTYLKMTIMDLAVQSKKGASVLSQYGIAAGQLGADLRTGGLDKALIDLRAHLTAAGVTGTRVGAVLAQAFTKRSSGPLAVLLGQFDRLQSKYKVLSDTGAQFQQAWNDRLNTTVQRFDDWRSSIDALSVRIGEYLLPVANSMFNIFTSVDQVLLSHQTLMQALLVGVGATAAAFAALRSAQLAWMGIQAGMAIAGEVTAFVSLIPEIGSAAEAWTLLSAAVEATPLGAAAVGIGAVAAAGYALFRALNVTNPIQAAFTKAMKQVVSATAPTIDHIQALAGTYNHLTGAITKSTMAMVQQDLERSGALKAGLQLGLSEQTLIDAAEGDAQSRRLVANAYQAAARMQNYYNLIGISTVGMTDKQAAAAATARARATELGNSIALVKTALGDEATSLRKATAEQKQMSLATAVADGVFKNFKARVALLNEPIAQNAKQMATLAEKYHLSAAQIKTVINAEMIPATVNGVEQMLRAMSKFPQGVSSLPNQVNWGAVSRSMQTHLSGLVTSNTANLASLSRSLGAAMGANLDSGLLGGIQVGSASVTGATRDLAHAAANAFANPMIIKSPSRLFHRYGLYIGQGLANGILASIALVKAAATKLGTMVTDTFTKRGKLHQSWTPEHQFIEALEKSFTLDFKNLTHARDAISKWSHEKAHKTPAGRAEALAAYKTLHADLLRVERQIGLARTRILRDPHATKGERRRINTEFAEVLTQLRKANELHTKLLAEQFKAHTLAARVRKESAKKAIAGDEVRYLAAAAAAGWTTMGRTAFTAPMAASVVPPIVVEIHTTNTFDGKKVTQTVQRQLVRHERHNTSNGTSARRSNKR